MSRRRLIREKERKRERRRRRLRVEPEAQARSGTGAKEDYEDFRTGVNPMSRLDLRTELD